MCLRTKRLMYRPIAITKTITAALIRPELVVYRSLSVATMHSRLPDCPIVQLSVYAVLAIRAPIRDGPPGAGLRWSKLGRLPPARFPWEPPQRRLVAVSEPSH